MRPINADKVYKTLESYEIKETIGKPLNDWEYGYNCGIERAKSEIECAPTVESEPVRHAHWIWKGDEGDSRFMCSECGGKEYVPTCMGIPNIWECCPNCGARMEEYELAKMLILQNLNNRGKKNEPIERL